MTEKQTDRLLSVLERIAVTLEWNFPERRTGPVFYDATRYRYYESLPTAGETRREPSRDPI